jgi:hypothetical protein
MCSWLDLLIFASTIPAGRENAFAGWFIVFISSTNTGTAVVPPVSLPIGFGSS